MTQPLSTDPLRRRTPRGARPDGGVVRLCADRVWTGRTLRRDAAVLVAGHEIVAVGAPERLPCPDGAVDLHFAGATVMPGLIDAHAHLTLRSGEDLVADPTTLDDATHHRWALDVARRVVRRGVTTIRDLGGRGTAAQLVRDEVAAGRSPGPRIVTAGMPLTSPRGHFWTIGIECAGEHELRAAVDRVASDGADLVKLIVTGGALTPGSAMGRAQFSQREVQAAVAHAHDLGLRVAAHAHGVEGIERAVLGGVDTIEHCSWMDLDSMVRQPVGGIVDEMRRRGQVMVIANPVPASDYEPGETTGAADLAPDAARWERIRRMWTNGRAVATAGVPVALGTDSLFGQFADCSDLIHRAAGLERVAGWPPCDVLAALGPGAAAALGANGRIGQVAPGALADLLVVRGDPTSRLASLWSVAAVFLGGQLVLSPDVDDDEHER